MPYRLLARGCGVDRIQRKRNLDQFLVRHVFIPAVSIYPISMHTVHSTTHDVSDVSFRARAQYATEGDAATAAMA